MVRKKFSVIYQQKCSRTFKNICAYSSELHKFKKCDSMTNLFWEKSGTVSKADCSK